MFDPSAHRHDIDRHDAVERFTAAAAADFRAEGHLVARFEHLPADAAGDRLLAPAHRAGRKSHTHQSWPHHAHSSSRSVENSSSELRSRRRTAMREDDVDGTPTIQTGAHVTNFRSRDK